MLQLCPRQTAALRSNYLTLNQFIQTPRHRCWRRSPGIQTVTFRTHPGAAPGLRRAVSGQQLTEQLVSKSLF